MRWFFNFASVGREALLDDRFAPTAAVNENASIIHDPSLLTDQSKSTKFQSMARPREFDRDAAVELAMLVFWRKGYAATSTEDLLRAMKIGRQSMYDTFGDKRSLYLEALERYQRESVAENIGRLRSAASPLAGIEAFVIGIVAADKSARERGCMGVGSISEFGPADPDLVTLRAKSGGAQHRALVERLRDAQAANEVGANVDIARAARFLETMMFGLQVAAKAGASFQSLRDTAAFTISSLRNH
jgi:TetR/AcrR family transcriptional repressor of nem operon